jgi:hypothetical protein
VAEKVKVTIRASGAHPDVLTVQDAMRQVLDIFELLTADYHSGVEWKLVSATTNSPFHLEGEATSFEPAVDVSVIARAQKISVGAGLRSLSNGRPPRDWDNKRLSTAKRLFNRNLNGVGSTAIDFEIGTEPILITPTRAREAILVLETKAPNQLYELPNIREEIGSVEGTLSELSTYYNSPAVRIVDARTHQWIWCRLSDELQSEFEDKTKFSDIWSHKRVIVRGRIYYNAENAISYGFATDIQKIEDRQVSLEQIKDRDFTGGLSVIEYLDRFRDGSLG